MSFECTSSFRAPRSAVTFEFVLSSVTFGSFSVRIQIQWMRGGEGAAHMINSILFVKVCDRSTSPYRACVRWGGRRSRLPVGRGTAGVRREGRDGIQVDGTVRVRGGSFNSTVPRFVGLLELVGSCGRLVPARRSQWGITAAGPRRVDEVEDGEGEGEGRSVRGRTVPDSTKWEEVLHRQNGNFTASGHGNRESLSPSLYSSVALLAIRCWSHRDGFARPFSPCRLDCSASIPRRARPETARAAHSRIARFATGDELLD
ncbi:hypothetical protein DFP72DRAFT_855280 [Ephemerocybe angulata]|uniref:Uncharacterized protein n=1 Tax=Ephemerocybe angulata TaxID=980116 RepID=A0A8H6HIS9_9AGAR|nr:hypothetical protein DFP72DRAFT_855280 [Tulosesus angulatus]